ncbi:MAG: hypothetical protein AB9895_00620 [Negativicutes bacterium]
MQKNIGIIMELVLSGVFVPRMEKAITQNCEIANILKTTCLFIYQIRGTSSRKDMKKYAKALILHGRVPCGHYRKKLMSTLSLGLVV